MWRTVVPEWPQLIALALPASNQSQPPARHEISEVMAITSDVRGIRGEGAGAQEAGSGKAKGRGGEQGRGSRKLLPLSGSNVCLTQCACLFHKRKPLVDHAEAQGIARQ